MRNRLLVAFLIAGMLGGAMGASLGILLGVDDKIGFVGGAFAFFPVGGYVIKRQRRWLGLSVLLGLLAIAYFMMGLPAAIVAATASFLTFFIAAGIVGNWYEDSDWKALTAHLKIALGLNHGFQIVDNGRITHPKEPPTVFGPRNLFIKPYNAVILEQGARLTRVLGPSVTTTAPFEYVKHVFDLREVTEFLMVDRVATKEQLYVSFHLYVTYGIAVAVEGRRGDRNLNPSEEEALKYLAMHASDWREVARNIVKSRTRQLMNHISIDYLQSLTRFPLLESRIQNLANESLRTWHIWISKVLIAEITPPTEYFSAQTERWIASIEAQTIGIRDRGRAEAYRDALKLIATAYKEARKQKMSEEEIYRELLRRTIEELSGDPSVLLYMPLIKDIMDGLKRPDSNTTGKD